MKINTVNTFKADIADPGTDPADPASDYSAEEVDASLDEVFDTSGTDTTSTSSSPLDEYFVTDPSESSGEDMTLDRLTTYPPTLEEILLGNEVAARHPDIIKERYELAKEDLTALRNGYVEALPYVNADEAQMLQRKIELCNAAILKCETNIVKVDEMIEKNIKIYEQEMANGIDINGDRVIGDPLKPESLGVFYDDEGLAHYIDRATGNVVTNPMLCPTYQCQMLEGDNVSMISDTETVEHLLGLSTDYPPADMYLRVNDVSETHGDFNTVVDLAIPEWIWVPAENNQPKLVDGELKYEFDASLWTANGQTCPENRSDYVQVRVAQVEVVSEQVMETVDGEPLYNTYVKFLDADGKEIAVIRFEGYFGSGPAAAPTTEGNYIAFSNLGMSFNGNYRCSDIIFNAEGAKFTGRHQVNGLEDLLGSEMPPEERGQVAYQENLGLFQGDSFETTYATINGEGSTSTLGDPVTVNHSDSDGTFGDAEAYGSLTDRYLPVTPGDDDTVQCFQTGVFVTGLRGHLTGTNYNDIFIVPDVNFKHENVADYELPNSEDAVSGDPLYTTVVEGGRGHNILSAGKGDTYATGISFAWVEACSDDNVAISLVENATPAGADTRDDDEYKRNTKNFVWIDGAGHSFLYNTDEADLSRGGDAPIAEGDAYLNDYFRLSGVIEAGVPGDRDIVNSGLNADSQCGSPEDLRNEIRAMLSDGLEDAILGYFYDDSEFDAPTDWEEIFGSGGAAADQDAEMDEFFNEMFGGIEEFEAEMIEESL